MTFGEERTIFVDWFCDYYKSKLKYYIDKLNSDFGGCKGVSFVPIHKENGKFCVVMGKERAGYYTDQFNYFGGKVEKSSPIYNKQVKIVGETLFNETYEELGLILKPIPKGTYHDIFIHGPSIIFVTTVSNITTEWWYEIIKDRMDRNDYLPWKYQEMDMIKSIPLEEINSVDFSEYVLDSISLITHWVFSNWNTVQKGVISRKYFKDTKGKI